MKLKQSPEDFQVEELTHLAPGGVEGPFAFYRLDKEGWTTPDALAVLRRQWRIDHQQVSFGGLKDRHARTAQYLTIHHGPRRHLAQAGIRARYLGQLPAAYTSTDIRANRFHITLRDLAPDLGPVLEGRLAEMAEAGFPNYFDDQRFGSVSGGGDFMARALVHGQFEEALRRALTAPYEFDRAAEKREKALLRSHWGDWPRLRDQLPRGHVGPVVEHLCHRPDDFRGAILRLRPDLRGLYLSAFQSHLWNRLLARWLEHHLPAEELVQVALRSGAVPMNRRVSAELAALALPLPTARWRPADDEPLLPLLTAVLAEEGLTLDQLQVKGCRELFFSKGDRPALCVPSELRHDLAEDDRAPGRLRAVLQFDLPRGCYATLLVKRLLLEPGPAGKEARA